MSSTRFDEILKKYRSIKARMAYLLSQKEMLERFLGMCERSMVDDQVTMSQEITGMPHGSGISDPTGRLAMDIACGKVSDFVQQIRDEIVQVEQEINQIKPQIQAVEIVLDALTERERTLVTMKMIDDLSWVEVIHKVRLAFGETSKRTLQRMLEGAMAKAYEIVR